MKLKLISKRVQVNFSCLSSFCSNKSVFWKEKGNVKNVRRTLIKNKVNMALHNKDINAGELPVSNQPQQRADHNIKFYQEFRKIFETGYYLSRQLAQLVQTKEELYKKLLTYEKRGEEEFKDRMRKEAPQKKKRFRRTANEIQKDFTCHMPRCSRCYGSEGSLLQHIKNKHPDEFKKMTTEKQIRVQSESQKEQQQYYQE